MFGVVHHGQGLAFRLEAGDDLPGIHARLDDLDRHPALDRFYLVGHEDRTEAAFADFLEQLVGAYHHALLPLDGFEGGILHELRGSFLCPEQFFHLSSKIQVVSAGFIEVGLDLLRRGWIGSSPEDLKVVHRNQVHVNPMRGLPENRANFLRQFLMTIDFPEGKGIGHQVFCPRAGRGTGCPRTEAPVLDVEFHARPLNRQSFKLFFRKLARFLDSPRIGPVNSFCTGDLI